MTDETVFNVDEAMGRITVAAHKVCDGDSLVSFGIGMAVDRCISIYVGGQMVGDSSDAAMTIQMVAVDGDDQDAFVKPMAVHDSIYDAADAAIEAVAARITVAVARSAKPFDIYANAETTNAVIDAGYEAVRAAWETPYSHTAIETY